MHQEISQRAEANVVIGETLKEIRKKSGITQQELAHRLHTTQSFISDTEHGKRAIRLTEAILYSFGLSISTQQLYEELKGTLYEHGLI